MPGKINMFTWPPSLAAFKIYGTHDLPYTIFAMLIKDYKNVDIDEKILVDVLNMEESLTALINIIH